MRAKGPWRPPSTVPGLDLGDLAPNSRISSSADCRARHLLLPKRGSSPRPGRAWVLQVACRAVRDVRASAPAPAREGRSELRAGAPRAAAFLPFCPWAQSVSCISAAFCGDVRPPFRLPPIKIDYYLFLD